MYSLLQFTHGFQVLLLDTAWHVTPCELASSYRHFGLSVTIVQSARRHISELESSSRPL